MPSGWGSPCPFPIHPLSLSSSELREGEGKREKRTVLLPQLLWSVRPRSQGRRGALVSSCPPEGKTGFPGQLSRKSDLSLCRLICKSHLKKRTACSQRRPPRRPVHCRLVSLVREPAAAALPLASCVAELRPHVRCGRHGPLCWDVVTPFLAHARGLVSPRQQSADEATPPGTRDRA